MKAKLGLWKMMAMTNNKAALSAAFSLLRVFNRLSRAAVDRRLR
jgi:hypothetical protein